MVPNCAKHHIFYTVALVHLNAIYFSNGIITVKPNERIPPDMLCKLIFGKKSTPDVFFKLLFRKFRKVYRNITLMEPLFITIVNCKEKKKQTGAQDQSVCPIEKLLDWKHCFLFFF